MRIATLRGGADSPAPHLSALLSICLLTETGLIADPKPHDRKGMGWVEAVLRDLAWDPLPLSLSLLAFHILGDANTALVACAVIGLVCTAVAIYNGADRPHHRQPSRV